MKKNNASITFRPSMEVLSKLHKAMEVTNLDQSKTLRKALELGLDYLEAQGYDTSKALISATISKPQVLPPQESPPVEPLKLHPRDKATQKAKNG